MSGPDKMRGLWWWVDRWRLSSAYASMSAEAQGVYRNLLDEAWLRGGLLPADEATLCRASGDPEAWDRVRGVVLSYFTPAEGGLRNETLDELRGKALEVLDAKRKGGRARASRAERGPGGRFAAPATSRPADAPAERPADTPAESQHLRSEIRDQRSGDQRTPPPPPPDGGGPSPTVAGRFDLAPATVAALEELDGRGPCACTETARCDDCAGTEAGDSQPTTPKGQGTAHGPDREVIH